MTVIKRADARSGDIAELKRLIREHPTHAQHLGRRLDALQKGIRGEADAAYHIDLAVREYDRSYVVHDLRIEHDGDVAQIDHLVFDARYKRIVVIETKNVSGALHCNARGEWTAIHHGHGMQIPSPVEQARRHERILRRWTEERHAGAIRSWRSVVLVDVNTIIDIESGLLTGDEVIRTDMFDAWLRADYDAIPKLYALVRVIDHLDDERALALIHSVRDAHKPVRRDWMSGLTVRPTPSGRTPSPKTQNDLPGMTPASGPTIRKKTMTKVRGGTLHIVRWSDGTRTIQTNDDALMAKVANIARMHGGTQEPKRRAWRMELDAAKIVVAQLGDPTSETKPTEPVPPLSLPLVQIARPPSVHPEAIRTSKGVIRLYLTRKGEVVIDDPDDPIVRGIVDILGRERGRFAESHQKWAILPADVDDLRRRLSAIDTPAKDELPPLTMIS